MGFRRSFMLVVLLLGAFALAGAAFAFPWLGPARGSESMLERYSPLRNHEPFLLVTTDAQGKTTAWTSRTLEILSTSRALGGELPAQTRDALQKFMRREGESALDIDTLTARVDAAQVFRQTDRSVDAAGQFSEFVIFGMRDARGETGLSLYFPETQTEVVFDPPLALVPMTFALNSTWSSTSKAGGFDYIAQNRVTHYDAARDCFTIETDAKFVTDTRSAADYCAGQGAVLSRTLDANGALLDQTQTFFLDQPLPATTLANFSTDPAIPAKTLPTNYDAWTLTRLGRVGQNISAGEATIPPVWLPTNPPRVLASGYLGAFFAYDANEPAATALWSFPLPGTVYSPPAYDAARGRIYFGASDKNLYALDTRGLYLWSFRAEDNIAARPLLINNRVIFGSEDRHVYALNADTGQLDWQVGLAAPIVSSAAFAQGNVIVGSDDGTVYALDINTGETRWTFSADDAVQTSIIAQNNVAYVASRGGTVYALDAASGNEIWSADAQGGVEYAPQVNDDRVLVTNTAGELVAFQLTTGAELWRTPHTSFVGKPIIVKDGVIVAGSDGNVYWLNHDGTILQTWSGSAVSNAATRFKQSPALGDDAIWLMDDRAYLWRLGVPRANIAALNPAWADSIADAPFQLWGISTSPVAYGESAVVLDDGANVYTLDPVNGAAKQLGALTSGKETVSRLDSVIAGDTLYTIISNTLHAFDLANGKPLWQAQGTALSYRPVTVAENSVLWTQLAFNENDTRVNGTLTALDTTTGATRWQNQMQGHGYPTGVVAHNAIVYTAEPAAYGAQTGALRWRTVVDGLTVGEPALNETGDVLYVGASDGTKGELLALEAQTGSILWRKPTGTNTPNIIERVWAQKDVVIVSGLDGTIGAVDAQTGAPRWTYTPPTKRLGTLSVQGTRVWFLLQNGRVQALDVATGALVAQFSDLAINLTGGSAQHPLEMGNILLVPYETHLLGLKE